MYQSTFTSSEAYTNQSHGMGNYETLKQRALRLLETIDGEVEIRDAHGTLAASITADNGEIKVWENK